MDLSKVRTFRVLDERRGNFQSVFSALDVEVTLDQIRDDTLVVHLNRPPKPYKLVVLDSSGVPLKVEEFDMPYDRTSRADQLLRLGRNIRFEGAGVSPPIEWQGSDDPEENAPDPNYRYWVYVQSGGSYQFTSEAARSQKAQQLLDDGFTVYYKTTAPVTDTGIGKPRVRTLYYIDVLGENGGVRRSHGPFYGEKNWEGEAAYHLRMGRRVKVRVENIRSA